MKLTKEEALKRFKNALDRKKAWEEKFEAKYADVTNLETRGLVPVSRVGNQIEQISNKRVS